MFFKTSCRENQNTRFIPPENRDVYEKMWINIVEPRRLQMKIWRMRFACWIPKDINTLTEYILLFAFFTATAVAQMRFNVTLYVHCVVILHKKCI